MNIREALKIRDGYKDKLIARINAIHNFLTMNQNYKKTFNTKHGTAVLVNIAVFCKIHKQGNYKDLTGKIDPYQLAIIQGRREVYAYIFKCLNPNQDELNEFENELTNYTKGLN